MGFFADGAGHAFADDDFEAVGHDEEPTLAGERGDSADVVGVDDGLAVDTAELGRGKAFFESLEGVVGEVAAGSGENVDGFAVGLKRDNLVGVEHVEVGAEAADNAAERLGGFGAGSGGRGGLANPQQGGFEAFAAHGLEEVVESADIEGFEGVPVIGRDEDDGGAVMGFELAGDGEAVKAGHLEIEEDDVGAEAVDQLDGFESVVGFTDDRNAADLFELLTEDLAGDRFVVGNESAHQATALSRGTSKPTEVREGWESM